MTKQHVELSHHHVGSLLTQFEDKILNYHTFYCITATVEKVSLLKQNKELYDLNITASHAWNRKYKRFIKSCVEVETGKAKSCLELKAHKVKACAELEIGKAKSD